MMITNRDLKELELLAGKAKSERNGNSWSNSTFWREDTWAFVGACQPDVIQGMVKELKSYRGLSEDESLA